MPVKRVASHRGFVYCSGLTESWNRSVVKSRYHSATLQEPMGIRSGKQALRPVDGILNLAHDQLGESFSQFTNRVCQALHGDESSRREAVKHEVSILQAELKDGGLPGNGGSSLG